MTLDSVERRIGETLIYRGCMTESNVQIVLLRQEYGDSRLFGEIATSLKLLSEKDLMDSLQAS